MQHQATALTSAPRGQTESEGFLLCQAEGTRLGSARLNLQLERRVHFHAKDA